MSLALDVSLVNGPLCHCVGYINKTVSYLER